MANEHFEEVKQKMVLEGFKDHSKTLSVKKATYLSLLLCVPFMLFFIFSFQIRHGKVFAIFDSISQLMILFISSLFLIVIHEAIHGLTWGIACEKGMKSIRFGVFWSSFTPYCHCKEPLTYYNYLLGALMPFIILGIGITAFGIVNGSLLLFWLGIFNILASGGDLLIAVMLRHFKNGKIVDHPSEIGFVAYQK